MYVYRVNSTPYFGICAYHRLLTKLPLPFASGLLGPRQEARAAQALPLDQLAHLILKVHARARAVVRDQLPRVPADARRRARAAAERRRPHRDRAGIYIYI